MKSRTAMGMALKLNDLAGYDRNKSLNSGQKIPASRLFSQEDCRAALPGLPIEGVTGAALWHDAQIYDTERLTLSFIISAKSAGADVGNYVEAVGFLRQENKILGVTARDIITKEEFEIQSKVVVNAAGPWIDTVLNSLDQDSSHSRYRHSLAVNIITRRIVDNYAAGVPSWPNERSKDGSDRLVSHMLFVSPWRNFSLIGTFHSHYQGDPNNFLLGEDNLQNIILEVNSAYPGANLELDDIQFVHYGFLPEKPNPNDPEVKLVRKSKLVDHRSENDLCGLISVMGVKYTTARYTAEKAVDLVFEYLGKSAPPSKTHITQLHGGQIDHFGDYLLHAIQEDSPLLASNTIDHWIRSYGTNYSRVKAMLPETGDLSQLDIHSFPVIKAQVIYAIREEMAIKLSDVILRRTGIGSIGRPDDSTLETIAEIMATELGWSVDQANNELEQVEAIYRRHGFIESKAEILETS